MFDPKSDIAKEQLKRIHKIISEPFRDKNIKQKGKLK